MRAAQNESRVAVLGDTRRDGNRAERDQQKWDPVLRPDRAPIQD
jgi:hypothetical protein